MTLAGNGLLKPEWGPNVEEFHRRFDPENTKGQGQLNELFVTKHSSVTKSLELNYS